VDQFNLEMLQATITPPPNMAFFHEFQSIIANLEMFPSVTTSRSYESTKRGFRLLKQLARINLTKHIK